MSPVVSEFTRRIASFSSLATYWRDIRQHGPQGARCSLRHPPASCATCILMMAFSVSSGAELAHCAVATKSDT